jgi:hypothetical protein
MMASACDDTRQCSALSTIRAAAGSALLCLCMLACSKDNTPAPEQPPPSADRVQAKTNSASEPAAAVPGPAAETAQAAAAAGASDSVREANFELTLTGAGPYRAGQPGQAEVVLIAKEPFHVNEKYPYKFKLESAAGLKFPNMIVKDDAVKLEKQRAVVSVPFTPEAAGAKKLAGQLSFSVCTDERCLIEKRDLALAIDVK